MLFGHVDVGKYSVALQKVVETNIIWIRHVIICYDSQTPIEETLRTIDDLVRQGKILYAGVSEWSAAQIEEAMRVADKYLLDRIIVNQPQYNMFHHYIEKEVIPVSEKYGVGQFVYSSLAQSVLTGKYKGNKIPENSR